MSHRRAIARGGAAGWTPASPTTDGDVTAAHWWDASELDLSDAAAVALWSDLIGTAHLQQPTESAKPSFRTAIIGALPVVRFDGNDYLAAAAPAPNIDGDTVTLFVVARENSHVDNAGVFVMRPPAGDDWNSWSSLVFETGGGGLRGCWQCSGASGMYCGRSGSGTLPLGIWVGRTYTTGGAFHVGAESEVTDTYSSGSITTLDDGIIMGSRLQGGAVSASYMLNGDVAEVVLYGSALSAADITQVSEYLAAKWGLAA